MKNPSAPSPRSGIRQNTFSAKLPSTVQGAVGRAVRQENEIKGLQIRKEEVKLSLPQVNIHLSIENPVNNLRKEKKKKKIRINEQLQRSCRIQDEYIKSNCVSIH